MHQHHHHHHLPPPVESNISRATTNTTRITSSTNQHQRRRKKRPNYGNRTVEVRRGFNGFGFTISGQQPCRLSCIISNSPADQAGLRPGDFLISVNGLNVSKLPHETVVQLIGNSFGSIRMQIAENYYSDSSEEDTNLFHQYPLSAAALWNLSGLRSKPRHIHHKTKLHRMRNIPQKNKTHATIKNQQAEQAQLLKTIEGSKRQQSNSVLNQSTQLRPLIEHLPLRMKPITTTEATPSSMLTSTYATSNVANVSAMVRVPNNALEYRAILGYLGTIEMPKQISHSSKLQTVRSCIRKLRQEKRQPTPVLMTILPDCLQLSASNGEILATYSSSRLNYVSSSSESENRFFGLVTSSVHTSPADEINYNKDNDDDDDDDDDDDHDVILSKSTEYITISNSCHVFVVDTKLCEHQTHSTRAQAFRIECTKDPISDLCLEFPSNSEYVVNLIRSMYTMRMLPPSSNYINTNVQQPNQLAIGVEVAHSPQPSNHSEISTTTSNSDSGIGFHNDYRNISDRIVLVNFPQVAHEAPPPLRTVRVLPARPLGIFQQFNFNSAPCPSSASERNRLSVRAKPDSDIKGILNTFMITSRSCGDALNLLESNKSNILDGTSHHQQPYASMDDISIHNTASLEIEKEKKLFLHPSCVHRQSVLQNCVPCEINRTLNVSQQVPDKLSPQVYPLHSISHKSSTIIESDIKPKSQNPNSNEISRKKIDSWTSLQNIIESENLAIKLDQSISESNLTTVIPNDTFASPCGRMWWSQISLRMPRSDKRTIYMDNKKLSKDNKLILQRSISMAKDDPQGHIKQNIDLPERQTLNKGVLAWALSFEHLLGDPNGLKNFAEFLKVEYSAENIYFWTACERFRHIQNANERIIHAEEIFNRHLANSATEPVNVDAEARTKTEEKLKYSADIDVFEAPQKQIFNLMKYDSYQRFLRSDLYKKCQQAEESGEPLPYCKDHIDDSLHINFPSGACEKLRKSTSNAEDRRCKSLLPWHRKVRRKSRDINEDYVFKQEKCTLSSLTSKILEKRQNSGNDIHSSRSSLSSYDSSTINHASPLDLKTAALCRVKLPNESTTIIQIEKEKTVKQLIDQVLEKRGLHYQIYEVFVKGLTTKSINLQTSSKNIAGKELEIEYRVAFKLDLPDSKVISVKSKPCKLLHQVLKPILQKYHYKIEEVEVVLKNTQEIIDLQQPVIVIDSERLQVKLKTDKFIKFPPYKTYQAAQQDISKQLILDEITNKVFKSLLQDKLDHTEPCSGANVKNIEMRSLKSDDCESETSSLFQRICSKRRDSTNITNIRLTKSKKKISDLKDNIITPKKQEYGLLVHRNLNIEKSVKNPSILVKENHDDLLEDLKRAQLARLEDQRGIEINIELPDFLKNEEHFSQSEHKLREDIKHDVSEVSTGADRPQPAPRLSIAHKCKNLSGTPNSLNSSGISSSKSPTHSFINMESSPPPLPPKPKVLPIKPSNWVVHNNNIISDLSEETTSTMLAWPLDEQFLEKISQITVTTDSTSNNVALRGAYLEETSSSFV